MSTNNLLNAIVVVGLLAGTLANGPAARAGLAGPDVRDKRIDPQGLEALTVTLIPPQTAPQSMEADCEILNSPHDEISPAQEQDMQEEFQRTAAMLSAAGRLPQMISPQAVTYDFPLRMAPGLPDYAGFRVSAFSDHNSAGGAVLDYNGGARTYDTHRGTDYALYPFSWNKVDAGEVQVIAAAAGTIWGKSNTDVTDHHPCDGGSSTDQWNYVALTHSDGRMTIYGHMRYNSLTSKGVGQTVAQGEYLGEVASSGNSSGAHLHFEVRYGSFSNAEWIDPYAGPNSQPTSLWGSQRPYYDSAINKLSTHFGPPSTPDPCQPSITKLQDSFTTLSNIYLYAHYRDYQGTLTTQLKIYRPDGSVYESWSDTPGSGFSSASSNGWVRNLPTNEPAGTWRFEATYNSQVYQTFFDVNSSPTNILLSSTNVAENLPVSTTIGSFSTQDPDAGNTFTYTLVAGTGSGDNGSFTISGSNLLTAAAFNYEVKSNYSIRVQSTDQGGLSTQKVFAINVSNVNETPAFIGIDSPTGINVVLRWSSVTNHLYSVHYSTNLMTGFSVLKSNITATPIVNSYTDSVQGVLQKFWQITTDP
jgi:murein DD-endopeptidase MepM/ murein hydrolase activator NlpD